MKLYTEDQLLNTIKSIRHYDDVYDYKVANERIEKHLKALHPIVLPNDEEMREYVYDNITPPSLDKGDGVEQMYFDTGFYVGFRAFAKWMKDKIENK